MSKKAEGSQGVMRYPHVASRVFDTPLLIEHSKLVAILNVLGPRLGFDAPTVNAETAIAYGDPQKHLEMTVKAEKVDWRDEGYMVADGVAVIPIIGTLVQRSDWMSEMSGMSSYGRIERMFFSAMDDPMVREVVLEIDSPGGEVAGAFDLADRMFDARQQGAKPVIAAATEFAASAAYLIASTADEIVVPRTGYVGSVGVVGTHVDYSKAMEKRGVAVTFIYAGEKKVDGNPYQPLSESVKAEWQAEIDQVYQIFVETVARNLDIGADRVRGTQAGMFMGFKAVDAGLAHRVNSFSNELANAVLRKTSAAPRFIKSTQRKEIESMNAEQEAKIKAEAEAKAKAEAEAKLKAEAEARAKAEAEAKAKADADAKAKAEAESSGKARIKAILECDEAKGRKELATHLALDTDVAVDQAKTILAKSPKASKLDSAMEHFNPNVGGEAATEPQPFKAASTDEIYQHRAGIFSGGRK